MAAFKNHVERLRPDAIVFTGDLVDLGPTDPAGLERGRDLLRSFGVPAFAVPGNHDVGNKLSIGRHVVTRAAVDQWRSIFDGDRFSCDAGGWLILGLNSQITGSGWPEEQEQFDWLTDAVDRAPRVAVFMHMPPYLYDPAEDLHNRDGYWQVDLAPRRQLLPLLQHDHVHLIASGHVHWHADFHDEHPRRAWCPSCYSVVREPHYPPGGDVTGLILYTFGTSIQLDLIADPTLSRPEGEQPHEA